MTITYPNHSSTLFDNAVSLRVCEGALIDLKPPTEGVNVEVQNGKVWVTQEGDSSDHVLGAGDSFRTSGNGLVIVQALQDSAFRFRGTSQSATA